MGLPVRAAAALPLVPLTVRSEALSCTNMQEELRPNFAVMAWSCIYMTLNHVCWGHYEGYSQLSSIYT